PIDMCLAGQAGNFVAGAAQMSANGFKTVIDIDILGTYNVFRAAVHQSNRPGASFIAITAPQANQPWLFQSHVCAAKAGVNMLVKCLAMEWGVSGIRVNAISPGPIEGTEGMARLAPTEEMHETYRAALALKQFGNRDDIADAALWLSSDGADYVTGTILEVEGGTTLGDATNAMKI
ncbi:MAG: SDR family oxidoreductase, partial [Pseudomonadota bacterium]